MEVGVCHLLCLCVWEDLDFSMGDALRSRRLHVLLLDTTSSVPTFLVLLNPLKSYVFELDFRVGVPLALYASKFTDSADVNH